MYINIYIHIYTNIHTHIYIFSYETFNENLDPYIRVSNKFVLESFKSLNQIF